MVKKLSLKDLERQVAELTEALQRERADSENIRRRHDEQIANLKNLVKANVVRELLPVIDNVERLLQHAPADSKDNPWKAGVEKIVNQLQKTLEDIGVKRIKSAGQVFDPLLHEAVSMEDGDGTVEVVSEELQPGYILGDEVIRHAMVRVRMGHPQSQESRGKSQEETAK